LPLSEVESIGFQIAIIPEPRVDGIIALGMTMLVWT
jgi:hypothetical protein